jgi:hypothetical protein
MRIQRGIQDAQKNEFKKVFNISLQREHVTEKSQFHKHYRVYHGLSYMFLLVDGRNPNLEPDPYQ